MFLRVEEEKIPGMMWFLEDTPNISRRVSIISLWVFLKANLTRLGRFPSVVQKLLSSEDI